MKETEIKSIIDEKTYNDVLRAFKWDTVTEQENHYYTDSGNILSDNRITVRIRVIDGVSRLQIKRHKNKDSALQISEETELAIDGVPEVIAAEAARDAIGMEVGELRLMGMASTLRHTLRRDSSELCLDKTTYFNSVDYEVEMEYVDKMSADLLMKLTALGVTFNKKCVGKFSRFLDEYKKHS